MLTRKSSSASAPTQTGDGFGIRTPLARATGAAGRYALDAVRVLPLPGRAASKGGTRVVLQASDGHQAVCLITGGRVSGPGLVPANVLPARRLNTEVRVQRESGDWRSSEGKVAPAVESDGQSSASFPAIGDVLPEQDLPRKRSGQHAGDAAPTAIALDLGVLKKVADALGTMKLTLLVHPLDASGTSTGNGQTGATPRPIGVCPASSESGVQGIGVVMPLQPEHGHAYFTAVCEQIRKAEKRQRRASRSSKR